MVVTSDPRVHYRRGVALSICPAAARNVRHRIGVLDGGGGRASSLRSGEGKLRAVMRLLSGEGPESDARGAGGGTGMLVGANRYGS